MVARIIYVPAEAEVLSHEGAISSCVALTAVFQQVKKTSCSAGRQLETVA